MKHRDDEWITLTPKPQDRCTENDSSAENLVGDKQQSNSQSLPGLVTKAPTTARPGDMFRKATSTTVARDFSRIPTFDSPFDR